jgi:AAA family ATP:ADP antiporter
VGKGIGVFYANFFSVVNILGLVTQLFLVSRIVRYLGVRWAIRILPLVALGGYALMAFFPLLAVARWSKTLENATDYSLQNTVRNMLFFPTTRQEKYKAKQAIDSFFMRAGDVLAGLLVLVGTGTLGLSPTGFALVNVGLAVIWLVLVTRIARKFAQLTA